MKKTLYAIVICLTFFVVSSRATANISLMNFQLNGIGAFQSGGGDAYSGQIGWTPYVGILGFGVRGDLGATILKNGFDKKFAALNMEVLASIPFIPIFSLEAGGGFQLWTGDNGGLKPSLTGNLVFNMPILVDRIFAGYSRMFLGKGVNIIRAGVGVNL